MLHNALEHARRRELIVRNVAEQASRPSAQTPVHHYYDSETMARLFEVLAGTTMEPVVKLAGYLGLRRSEICGLKWSHVDRTAKVITIAEARTAVNGRSVDKETKNRSSVRRLGYEGLADLEEVIERLWRQREEDSRKARTFREQMEKGKESARAKGEAEAKRIVRQAQQQAEEIFAQLDQLRKEQQKQANVQALNDAKAAVRHHLKTAEEQLHLRDEEQEPAYTPPRPIAVDDQVELPGVKMAATVLAVNGDGTLLLQAGRMKMTVKAQQVRLLEGAPKKSKPAPSSSAATLNTVSRASSELDIRGYETLEAESVVENYLDSAVMAKLGTVTIIHGKGTGALRKAVHEILKRNKAVKSFRLGRYGEGEAGVTVVELK